MIINPANSLAASMEEFFDKEEQIIRAYLPVQVKREEMPRRITIDAFSNGVRIYKLDGAEFLKMQMCGINQFTGKIALYIEEIKWVARKIH